MKKCIFCGTDLGSGAPYWGEDKKRLCRECSMESAESFVKLNLGGFMIFWLAHLQDKYFGNIRKKRNCYLPQEVRKTILEKYKFTCQICGTNEKLTIDHIKPVSKGGNDELDNLTILCKSCNSKKSNKYVR